VKTTSAERWGIHPEHTWLRGERPSGAVAFDEETAVWNVYGHEEAKVEADFATRTRTSPSAGASTSTSARRRPGSKAGSRSTSCSTGSRASAWTPTSRRRSCRRR